ncbi:MAG: NAD(+) synthase [Flavobacteriales bacterium]|jgi:NAD+ synthase|nr:NAD(+) synthase [Flavobacteriales bacterium]
MDVPGVIDHITDWLRGYCTTARQEGFAVGVSGGVDSAVTSALCARTGLPVHCVEMPIHQAPAHVQRAQEHIAHLQRRHPAVQGLTVDLTPVFDRMAEVLPTVPDPARAQLALANTRARLRMTTLYHLAGLHRLLVAGTGNKVEDFGVGFFTKYGDGGVDLGPIADLTKSEVYLVAKELGVAAPILEAPPTDGLFGDDRTDEAQIGATYPELERAMALRERDGPTTDLTPREREVLAIFDRMHAANRHKMEPVPVCIIPARLRV